MAYPVPISTLPILQDPPFVAYLLLLGAALGRRAMRLARFPSSDLSLAERALIALGIGLGILSLVPLGLSALPLPFASALRGSLWLIALPLLPDIFAVLRAAWRRLSEGGSATPDRFVVAGVSLLALPLAVALLQALCPPTDSDGLGYHLAAPRRWLSEGGLTYLPTLLHTNSPMGVEMFYLWALAAWSESSAKLVHYAFGVLTLAGIGALGMRLGSARSAVLAAFIFLLAIPRASAMPSFSIAYVDLAVSFETTAAAIAMLALWRTGDFRWGSCAAALGGFAASFKLTGLVVSFLTVVAVLYLLRRSPRAAQTGDWPRAAWLVLLAFLPAAPWLARSWVLTGNPIYPFLASVFPTRDWTPEAGAAFSGLMRYYIWAEGSAGLYPTRRVALVALTFGFVAILLAIAVCRARSADRRALLGVSGFTALSGIAGAGLHFRYSLPVTPLLSALIASQAASILGRSRAVAAAALAAIALGCGLYAFRKPGPNDATPGAIDALAAATGRTSRDQYLTRRLSNYRLWKFANANLPPNSRVLLATSGASYYADFPCWITMAYHQRIFSLEDWRDFLADVEQAAITHLVSSPKLKGPRPGPEYLPARNEYAFAARLGEEFGSLLHSERGDRLYRLDRDAIAGAVREEAR